MPIPQWEFGFSAETFNLMQESGIDGDRVVGEQAAREALRVQAESDQRKLFEKSEPHVHSDLAPPPNDGETDFQKQAVPLHGAAIVHASCA